MATTPLKTASRAMSFATVLVAGFAAWVLGTQGSTPRDHAVMQSATGRTLEFAAVAAKSPADNPQDVAAKSSHSSPTKSPACIPPDLGRLSGHERDAIVFDDLEELGLAAEDEVRQPRTRNNKRPVMVFRPADVVQDPESVRVDSQLTALQKKIDQLAQAQAEQKSNDVQKAIETLRQIQENKQAEQIEKLWQQLRESQPTATDPTKPQAPKAETPKPTAPSEPLADDKADEDQKAGSIRFEPTIVVGGLIEEQANQSQSRFPGLGALPVVGHLFKSKTNDTTRTELFVLITPRVIRDPDAECEGELSRSENERHHQNFRDKLSPINRHDNDAMRLRDQIAAANNDKSWLKKLRRKPPIESHRVPSTPTSLSGEAIFEQEIPTSVPSPFGPVPPAPAPKVFEPPIDEATKKTGR